MRREKTYSLLVILHPFFWDWIKYPFRGIDRYNYELLKGFDKLKFPHRKIDSGYIKTHLEGIIKELLFPFRLFLQKADLVHAVHPMGAKWALLLRKKPLITTIHDLLPTYFKGEFDWGIKYYVKDLSIRLSALYSTHIIVGFITNKKELIRKYRIDPNRISVVPYGVDLDRYKPQKITKKRRETVIFIGEVARSKGIDSLIKAFSLVGKKVPYARLIVCSKGRDMEEMKNLVKKLKLSDKITFLGYIPENKLPEMYHRGDVFAFPSRYGFGLPALEAMASGIPTVTSNSFDAKDYLAKAAWLVNPEDPKEIANAIITLLTDDTIWKDYRTKGLKRARQFPWSRTVKETITVYDKVING